MEFSLTIQDLVNEVSKSKQSVYQLFNKNSEFVKQNSIRKQRKVYYNQAVLDFLIAYYKDGAPIEAEIKPIEAPAREDGGEAAQAQIKALQEKIDMLEAQLEEVKKDRDETKEQLGIALLCLRQEQEEKKLLLPAPKKTIGERFKGLFKKD